MTERIAIVGGGTGGTVLANKLADDLADEIDAGEVEVSLVTASPDHVYKPLFLYVAFGRREADQARRPIRELLDRRVTLHVARVTDVDADDRRLTREDGATLDYDYLALATGANVAPEDVPGLAEGGHHYYASEAAETLRDALAAFEGGRLVLSVVGMPHMCPVAPLEFAFIADDWFRERGCRDDVELVYTYPSDRVHSVDAIADWASPRMAERGIERETPFELQELDPDRNVAVGTDGTELPYDLFVTIPPHHGDDLIVQSGLGDDGWIDVDQYTLEYPDAEGVFAFGDTADLPTSKAGSAAHYEAGVVADRIASLVRGETPTATYSGKTMCFIETGTDEATFVSFEYDQPPALRPPSKTIHWAKLAYNESYWLTARGLL
jgi:sulfide:quinone oxidoreductase